MKTDDLRVLFKGVAFKASDIKTYMINLLQKFEVALLWDRDHLLIPSLLPTESDIVKGLPDSIIMVASNRSVSSACRLRTLSLALFFSLLFYQLFVKFKMHLIYNVMSRI